MKNRQIRLALGVVLAGSMALSAGCVGKKMFRRSVSDQNDNIERARTAVEENERRIGSLKHETSQEVRRLDGKTSEALLASQRAGDRATYAEKLARGTLLWEATLSNDQTKFAFDDYALASGAQHALDEVAQRITSIGHKVFIEIQGHTDSVGSNEYNDWLGLKRAESVRHYMHGTHQIPLHLIETVSFGETRPVADNGSSAGRAQNRRVVIRVLDPIAPLMESEMARRP